MPSAAELLAWAPWLLASLALIALAGGSLSVRGHGRSLDLQLRSLIRALIGRTAKDRANDFPPTP